MFDEWCGPFLKFLLGFACCEGLLLFLSILGVFLWRLSLKEDPDDPSDHT
jgi:hypothetical protein